MPELVPLPDGQPDQGHRPRTVAVVLLDWGGTITPFHDLDLLDLWRAAARVLVPDGPAARVEQVAAALAAAEQRWWTSAVASGRSGTTREVLEAAARTTGFSLGADLGDALEDAAGASRAPEDKALLAHLDAWAPHTVAEPDAADVLRGLRQRGIATGLLSNTHWPRAHHERWLERDGLLELLDARTYTSDLAHLKPHPEAFRAALRAVAGARGEPVADPRDVVFVGDRPIDDVAGARRLGMRTVLRPNPTVAPPEPGQEPDARITALSDLLPLVDRWRAGGARA